MLRRVLLHVIPAPDAIHDPVNWSERHRGTRDVDNTIPFVDHIKHECRAKHTDVVRLAAGRGIEGRTIEYKELRVPRVSNYGGVECQQAGLAVVEAFGHINSTASPTQRTPVARGTMFCPKMAPRPGIVRNSASVRNGSCRPC